MEMKNRNPKFHDHQFIVFELDECSTVFYRVFGARYRL